MIKTVVLGNGFDLQAGLKSSYGDYFERKFSGETKTGLEKLNTFFKDMKSQERDYLFKILPIVIDNKRNKSYVSIEKFYLLEQNKLSNAEIEEIKKLSFWDLIFYFSKNLIPNEWNDIEKTIRKIILENQAPFKNIFNYPSPKNVYTFCSYFFFEFFEEKRYSEFKDKPFDFLKSELTILEKDFTKYLQQQIDEKYKRERSILLQKILNVAFSTETYPLIKVNVLNFNYTASSYSEEISFLKQLFSEVNIKNIHGTLEKNNIIFGVDPKNISTKDKAYIFTKTYRQLIDQNHLKENILSFPNNNSHEIIFYGHSLSEADYSYFEAIFDKLNLYDSDTKLIFKYSIFDADYDIGLDNVDKVTKLLEEYATTLNNKDHKENLVSRLILENRIVIEEQDYT